MFLFVGRQKAELKEGEDIVGRFKSSVKIIFFIPLCLLLFGEE